MKSKLLIHWTGKDIDAAAHATPGGAHERYLERLLTTPDTGLWMMRSREVVYVRNNLFVLELPMTCFTEILVSRAGTHTRRYGQLGFGFRREFVLRNFGAPVIYVRSHTQDPPTQRLAGIMSRLNFLDECEAAEVGELYAAKSQAIGEATELLKQVLAFVKPMSNYGADDFAFLEEAEWRVTFDPSWYRRFSDPGGMTNRTFADDLHEEWLSPPDVVATGTDMPPFFLCFAPDDIAALVVPTAEVREAAARDERFKAWSAKRTVPVVLVTIDECSGF